MRKLINFNYILRGDRRYSHLQPNCFIYRVAAGPFPFQSATTNTGLSFGISDNRQFDGTSLKQPTQLDWSVGFVGLPNSITNRKALSWDTQTVCLQYFNSAGSTTMNSCLVPGSPYMTLTFTNAAVTLNSLKGSITSFQWVTTGKEINMWRYIFQILLEFP